MWGRVNCAKRAGDQKLVEEYQPRSTSRSTPGVRGCQLRSSDIRLGDRLEELPELLRRVHGEHDRPLGAAEPDRGIHAETRPRLHRNALPCAEPSHLHHPFCKPRPGRRIRRRVADTQSRADILGCAHDVSDCARDVEVFEKGNASRVGSPSLPPGVSPVWRTSWRRGPFGVEYSPDQDRGTARRIPRAGGSPATPPSGPRLQGTETSRMSSTPSDRHASTRLKSSFSSQGNGSVCRCSMPLGIPVPYFAARILPAQRWRDRRVQNTRW